MTMRHERQRVCTAVCPFLARCCMFFQSKVLEDKTVLNGCYAKPEDWQKVDSGETKNPCPYKRL